MSSRDEVLSAARAALRELVPARAAELEPLLELPPTGETSADHLTIAEATLVTSIETILTSKLGADAPPVISRFAEKRAESRAYASFLPRSGSTFTRTDGKGSSHVPLDDRCPACTETGGVHYEGSDVLEGSLEWVHVVHTEVEDQFSCSRCKYCWAEHRYI